ncbi:sugar phosphate nucleotidyltransferase [Thermoactinomyces mirandus]|uniref:Glucose-1-phosphate thymidylyltransferase n=1 Tax=Thermoactinomyces mirandus TaxID=2756294 RepID=A0A7W1XUX0_9BACL|nr:sugar phosphate nucleotidyltransferase [Thermoactinomyces mirandus]MBA4603646.1 NTP transferase domain-containing protein [Thermoactinomyces mirandus]
MKGIILAGGVGSRLYPLTKVTNKNLLPVGRYPMIFYAIHKLKQANILDILIITGKEHMGSMVNLLGSGHDFGVSFTYRVQEQAYGITHALSLAKGFVGNDLMTVILADNVFSDDLSIYIEEFKQIGKGAKILIKEVTDPERFGVPQICEGQIIAIEEKPKNPKSYFAVTGIYMYDSTVFDIISSLKPSRRGELEITDVNNAYISKKELKYDVLQGWWIDAGTHESWIKANLLARDLDLSIRTSLLR